MISKEDLITRAVEAVMDEDECRIGWLSYNTAEGHRTELKKAVDRLVDFVYSEDVVIGSVTDKVVGQIEGELNNIITFVGDKLYLQGFIDAAGLLGVQITHEDIQKGRDKENNARVMSCVRYFLDEEAKRISKKFGRPVSISVEGGMAL